MFLVFLFLLKCPFRKDLHPLWTIYTAQYNIEIHDFSGHISSSEMIILPLVGFHFMKILGSAKQAKLTFVYYAHIGIMGLAEAMRIELE